jgi:RNA polymerase sigma-70 factor (ECF subfamily)
MTPLRELQLLEAYRVGGQASHAALTELLSGYQRRIYSVCFRMLRRPEDAADLTQDVLLKLVENLSSYDGHSKLSTWVIRVTMNACLSHLRRQKVRDQCSLDDDGRTDAASGQPRRPLVLAGREPTPEKSVEQGQQKTAVLKALDSLDPDTRAILVLRDVQDMDYQQLADVLEVPIGTVKSRLFRARAALREAIEKFDHGSHGGHG